MPHEFDGDKYARVSSHQKEWGARLIGELDLKGDERILDLGCGDGALSAKLADLVPQGSVLGIDASRGMIEVAAKHVRANLRFELLDIGALAFSDAFDVVFSNATLHWVKDHRRLLANTLAVLSPGGVLRFNFGAEGNCANFNRIVKSAMADERFSRYFAGFDWPWYMPRLSEYEALLAEFPFRDARAWIENADRHFGDAAAITGWIDQPSIVPFLARVAEADKGAFRNAIVERMLAETRQSDGTYFETFRRMNVFARK